MSMSTGMRWRPWWSSTAFQARADITRRSMPPPVLLSCEALTKSYTSRPLFENLSFAIAEGDRVGLIGPNGSGKSTLLKILAGAEAADSGRRAVRKGVRIGYVPQDAVFAPGLSVEEVLLEAVK